MALSSPLHLASQSPRRARLLDQLGLAHGVVATGTDETPRPDEPGADYVVRMARGKAGDGASALGLPAAGPGLVLGADTAIELDGRILGKPAGAEQARAGLRALSGRSHRVLSAVAVTDGERTEARLNRTTVSVRPIGAEELEAYLASGEPDGKAGGYAIQGLGAVFVERLEGSYSAVMGLPLYETDQLLKAFGEGVL